jgi:hypothetical protein
MMTRPGENVGARGDAFASFIRTVFTRPTLRDGHLIDLPYCKSNKCRISHRRRCPKKNRSRGQESIDNLAVSTVRGTAGVSDLASCRRCGARIDQGERGVELVLNLNLSKLIGVDEMPMLWTLRQI